MSPPKNPQAIFEHLDYALRHLDGGLWVADYLDSHPTTESASIVVDGKNLVERKTLSFVTNAVAEAAILYCRKLLAFIGIRSDKPPGDLLPLNPAPRRPDDAVIEHLGLAMVTIDQLKSAPIAGVTPEQILAACSSILRSADKSVAHFTVGAMDRAKAANLRICAKAVLWAIETHVYKQLGRDVPAYRVWTMPSP